MAERRMFAKTIIDSDAFLDLPITSRLLYYDLAMRADDDGFVNSPKKIMRMIGASNDDMNILLIRKFVITFDSGVVVIKHWKIHNYIRKDTYNETNYKNEKATLSLDENKAYKVRSDQNTLSVNDPSTQERSEKISLVKDSLNFSVPSEDPMSEDYKYIINHLNQKTGKNFDYKSKLTIKYIKARMKDGYTVRQFIQVIDYMCGVWINDKKMKEYLRPSTLFNEKFEERLVCYSKVAPECLIERDKVNVPYLD